MFRKQLGLVGLIWGVLRQIPTSQCCSGGHHESTIKSAALLPNGTGGTVGEQGNTRGPTPQVGDEVWVSGPPRTSDDVAIFISGGYMTDHNGANTSEQIYISAITQKGTHRNYWKVTTIQVPPITDRTNDYLAGRIGGPVFTSKHPDGNHEGYVMECEATTHTDSCWALKPKEKMWTKLPNVRMLDNRTMATTTITPNDEIWVTGDSIEDPASASEIFNGKTFVRGPGLPADYFSVAGHAIARIPGTDVYFFTGGETLPEPDPVKEKAKFMREGRYMYKYEYNKKKWSKMTDAIIPRWNHVAFHSRYLNRKCIIVAGGQNDLPNELSITVSKTSSAFDYLTGRWKAEGPPLPRMVVEGKAIYGPHGRVFIVGGDFDENSYKVLEYEEDAFKPLDFSLHQPRMGMSAFAIPTHWFAPESDPMFTSGGTQAPTAPWSLSTSAESMPPDLASKVSALPKTNMRREGHDYFDETMAGHEEK